MNIDQYDEIMQALEKELILDTPDIRKIKKLVAETECPHLIKLVDKRIEDFENSKTRSIL